MKLFRAITAPTGSYESGAPSPEFWPRPLSQFGRGKKEKNIKSNAFFIPPSTTPRRSYMYLLGVCLGGDNDLQPFPFIYLNHEEGGSEIDGACIFLFRV